MRVRVLEAAPDAECAEEEQPGVFMNHADVPYDQMWADDVVWMPTLLASEASYFEGHFVFDGPPGAESRLLRHNWRAYDEPNTMLQVS